MLLFLLACLDPEKHDHDSEHEYEVITTVILTITDSTGVEQTITWTDPENDGAPVVDSIALISGETYALSVEFWNELENPAEELTQEILDEAEEHQVFFAGGALIEHTYDDADGNGNPLGLENSLQALMAGEGSLVVGLQHLPEEDGIAIKTVDLEAVWLSEGEAGLPGDWDALVEFPLRVSE